MGHGTIIEFTFVAVTEGDTDAAALEKAAEFVRRFEEWAEAAARECYPDTDEASPAQAKVTIRDDDGTAVVDVDLIGP